MVEGQTEEEFVNGVLKPHLRNHGVDTAATIVGTPRRRGSAPLNKGGGSWARWARDLRRILGEQHQASVRVTTLFDLYGLPADFPELELRGRDVDSVRRCQDLEAALAHAIDDRRLIPYLQRHEFEALVLASLGSLRLFLDDPEDLKGLDRLVDEVGEQPPEDVDDGETTAPSKRLRSQIPSYTKTVHGPMAIEKTGLAVVRARCPRFNTWLNRLENLSAATP